MSKVKKGKEAFEEYYRGLFDDANEAENLLESLGSKRLPILRFRKRYEIGLQQLWQKCNLVWKPVEWYDQAVYWPDAVPLGTELPGFSDRWFYPMSASSLIPVLALQVQPGDKVLDACAAPGGKAMAIVDLLDMPNQLVVNDLSYQRMMRMKQLWREFGYDEGIWHVGPAEKLRKKYNEIFDKVLLDAPCSSEAHVYQSKIHLDRWSIKRVEKLQRRQIRLIERLMEVIKPGGRLVYSTCAITPEENEVVVSRILQKGGVELDDWSSENLPGENGISEKENFDVSLVKREWPHKQNLDPMFVAVFRKTT